jgi:hypothetical protein
VLTVTNMLWISASDKYIINWSKHSKKAHFLLFLSFSYILFIQIISQSIYFIFLCQSLVKLCEIFIHLFGLFIHLFICAYIVWAISPPSLSSYPLASRQNLFCLLQFCWREDVSNNKKNIAVLLVWNKDSYTKRSLDI